VTASITVDIVNKKGLHARAAAKFVKVVTSFDAQIQVRKAAQEGDEESPIVSGSSILGLMMLGADPGSRLSISAEGTQAQEAVTALQELVQGRFGEPE
jgi:phosphocarrier protein HPr